MKNNSDRKPTVKMPKGFDTRMKKKNALRDRAIIIAGVLLLLSTLYFVPRTSESGWKESQPTVPGSTLTFREMYEDAGTFQDEFGENWNGDYDQEYTLDRPFPPLPPITLQLVYYDPITGKLWYLDDDLVPHEIIMQLGVEMGFNVDVVLDHEFEGRE